eukprot:s3572_g5.t1
MNCHPLPRTSAAAAFNFHGGHDAVAGAPWTPPGGGPAMAPSGLAMLTEAGTGRHLQCIQVLMEPWKQQQFSRSTTCTVDIVQAL